MKKSVWKVTGWDSNYPGEDMFAAYFSDRDTAQAVYEKGEREFGAAAGYTDMCWLLEGFDLDNDQRVDAMFEDVCEALEE